MHVLAYIQDKLKVDIDLNDNYVYEYRIKYIYKVRNSLLNTEYNGVSLNSLQLIFI